MKTAELTDELLDYWVAKAINLTAESAVDFGLGCPDWLQRFKPSTNPTHGWPIIEDTRISLDDFSLGGDKFWLASIHGEHAAEGPTALIAAMRSKVASVYGDEVPDHGN